MSHFPGRKDRRRRVLNEEVLSASSSHVALRPPRKGAGEGSPPRSADAPRYSEAASIEHHPRITDLIPLRRRTIAFFLLIGVAATVLLVALHTLAAPVAATLGTENALLHGGLDLAAPGSLASWMSAVLLLVTCAACLLIYSMRRHRIDDFRGRYRIWRWAAAICLLASVNSVAGLHALLADTLGHHVGWTVGRAGAVWWLILLGVPVAWIAARTFFDAKECSLATLLLLASAGAYATATLSFLGWSPSSLIAGWSPAVQTQWEPLITGGATLLGHWLLLAAAVAYARYVVLDAQGLIAVRRRPAAEGRRPRAAGSSRASTVADRSTKSDAPRPKTFTAKSTPEEPPAKIIPITSAASSRDWVDGSRPEDVRYEDEQDGSRRRQRKLTKAERKRLRKLKARNRAA